MGTMDSNIGSGVGSDYIEYCRRRAEQQREKFAAVPQYTAARPAHPTAGAHKEERTMPRGYPSAKAPAVNKLEGFTLYVPPRQLPIVGLQKHGDLTLPPQIAHQLGAWVQVFWSADRKALAIKATPPRSRRARSVRPGKGGQSAEITLGSLFKSFGVTVQASSKYGAELVDGLLILALTGISVNGAGGQT